VPDGQELTAAELPPGIKNGYATATIYYGDVCPDRNDGLPEGVNGRFTSTGTEDRPALPNSRRQA
jgi:hypothetical protein